MAGLAKVRTLMGESEPHDLDDDRVDALEDVRRLVVDAGEVLRREAGLPRPD